MEHAYLRRDAEYDGVFVLAVRTTRIFCRPSCPARKPKPQNVEFFATPREALRAGYRPCQRCRPLDTDGRPPDWIQPVLAALDEDGAGRLRDSDLRSLGVDPTRVRRWFRRQYGLTFQEYHRARRLGTALRHLRAGGDLTMSGLNHGYASSSGFREAFERVFGQPPGRGRRLDCVVVQPLASPLGPLLSAATAKGVCLLSFAERGTLAAESAGLSRAFRQPVVPGRHEHLQRLATQLEEYFAGRRRTFDLPLDCPGTRFQRDVWNGLLKIPFGETVSYAELARRIGRPDAQRAVGQANHRNRVGIIIPCHRVVNADGRLGGYGGGLWRKQALLEHEAHVLAAAGKRPRDQVKTC